MIAEHHQRGDQAVAGGRVIHEDDVAGLLAAEIVGIGAHLAHDRGIADLGANQLDAGVAQGAVSRPKLLITVATTVLS